MTERRLDLTIGVNADGSGAEVRKVSKEFEGLAGASAETKQKLQELSNQQRLIDQFVQIKRVNGDAAQALKDAQDKAQALGRAFGQLDAPTKKQTAEMQRAQREVQAAKAAYQQSTIALQNMRGTLAQSGVSTGNLAAAQVQLRSALAAARAEAQASAAANEKAAASHRKVSDGVQSLSQQIGGLKNTLLAVAGINFGAGMVKDVAQTADAVKNLQGRIQLAIGASGDLTQAWQQVVDVALRSHSSLETTGELFTKLVKAGTDAGQSTQAAIAQSIKLTETINQTIQLSGATAQASDAAIKQLIQGLQSGVLRGDEFNSVMEQAPRLADALSASLGVTRGQLRSMAEDGKLSAQTVISALESQSATIAKEFEQLPLTIGRAVTDLQTKWTQFMGGLDQSTGSSALVAQGIKGIADHLEMLAGMATRAGMALAAGLAVQGVMALRTFAAEMVVAGNGASLLSLKLSQVPKTLNIAIAATGFEVGYQIGTMLYENSELVRKLGIGLVAYTQMTVESLTLLKDAAAAVFTDDTIDAAFARYQDRLKVMGLALDGMWADAKNAPKEVEQASNQAGAAMTQMGQTGQTAGQAVATAAGVAAGGVGKVAQAAETAAQALVAMQTEGAKLPKVIEKLSGAELATFKLTYISAMRDAGKSTQDMGLALDAVAAQAAQSLGVDIPAASSRITPALDEARSNLNLLVADFDRLKANGVNAALLLEQGITKMLEAAKNQADLQEVERTVTRLRDQLGEKVADGLLDQAAQKATQLRDKLDEARAGVDSLREAHKLLGLQSVDDLQRMASQAKSAYDTIKAAGAQEGESYEAWQARKTAAAQAYFEKLKAANGGVVTEAMKTQAAVEGVALAHDKAGASGVAATSNIASGWRNASAEAAEYQKQVSKQVDDINARHGQSAADYDRKYGKKEVKSQIDTKDRGSGPADNSGKYAAWRKFQTGKLSLEDEKLVDAVMQSAEANSDVASKYWHAFSLEGRASIDASYNQARQMKEEIERLKRDALAQKTAPQSALPSVGGSSSTKTGTSQTFVSNVNIGGQTKQLRFSDSSSQKAAEDLLRQLAAQQSVSQ